LKRRREKTKLKLELMTYGDDGVAPSTAGWVLSRSCRKGRGTEGGDGR